MRRAASFLAAGMCVLGASCATVSPSTSPGEAVRAYVAAVRSSDVDALYAMLDDDTRARLTPEQARALFAENRASLVASSTAIERALPNRLEGTASIDLGGGETVSLSLEEDDYRLDGGVLDLVSLASPEQAVAALRRALARGSLASLLRVLSADTRTDVHTAVEQLIDDTEDPLALDIRIVGDTATVLLPSGRVIHLVFEEGEWHVVDLP